MSSEKQYDLNAFTAPSYHVCQAVSGCTILTNKRVSKDGWPGWYLCDHHRTETECARLQEQNVD